MHKDSHNDSEKCFLKGYTAPIRDDDRIISGLEAKDGALTDADRETLNGIRAKLVSTDANLAFDLMNFEEDFGKCQADHVNKGDTDLTTSQKAVEEVQKLMAAIKATINALAVALGSMDAIRDADLRYSLGGLLEGLNETLGLPLNFGRLRDLGQLSMMQQDKIDLNFSLQQDDAAWGKVEDELSLVEGGKLDRNKSGKIVFAKGGKLDPSFSKGFKQDEQDAAKLDLQLRFASAKAYLDSA